MLLKMCLFSFIVMLVLVSCSVTLIYYGLMRASGKTTSAGERIREFISLALPDNIRSVSGKVKSNISRISDIVVTN